MPGFQSFPSSTQNKGTSPIQSSSTQEEYNRPGNERLYTSGVKYVRSMKNKFGMPMPTFTQCTENRSNSSSENINALPGIDSALYKNPTQPVEIGHPINGPASVEIFKRSNRKKSATPKSTRSRHKSADTNETQQLLDIERERLKVDKQRLRIESRRLKVEEEKLTLLKGIAEHLTTVSNCAINNLV